jgi:hypothetical protein
VTPTLPTAAPPPPPDEVIVANVEFEPLLPLSADTNAPPAPTVTVTEVPKLTELEPVK